jgi:hypothetical protein
MTRLEVALLVRDLSDTYPAARMSLETVSQYERLLRPLSKEALRNAIDKLALTNKFLPSVAELVEAAQPDASAERAAERARRQAEFAARDAAEFAAKARRSVERYGHAYDSGCRDPRALVRRLARRMGGES